MDIVTLAKFVPDIERIPPDAWDRERGTLIRSRLDMAFNPLDRVALRMAFDVRRARPGTRIVALSMGPPGAITMLREAIAYGADGAVLLTDRRFAGADTIATAYTLSRAVRQMVDAGIIGEDYAVFSGMQSPDGDTAQVPAQVASLLDAPLYPYVRGVAADDDQLELTCLNSVGFQRVLTGRRPFVATATQLYPDLPFYVSLYDMQRANDTQVVVWGRDDVELDDRRIGLDGSRTRVVEIFEPERKHQTADPIEADDDSFPRRARDLLEEWRSAFGRAEAPESAEAQSAAAHEPAESYYRGDCAALCEPAEGRLAAVSREMIAACARMADVLGVEPLAIVPGRPSQAIADELAACGARRAWFVPELAEETFRVRDRALALAELVRELRPQIVIAPATLTGRVLAPYVSARLDCGLTADCSALRVADFERRGDVFPNVLFQTRPALGGNIMATIVSIYDDPASRRPQMATVRPGALSGEASPASECEVSTFHSSERGGGWGDRIELEPRPEGETAVDLKDYEVLVSVGMGVGDRATISDVVEPFRSALEEWLGVPVGLGCSRAVVDAGVLPHAHQVGQTGVVVKPAFYFALGISGAIQHKIGMENARVIVAINRDPDAPIAGFADHFIAGEVEQVLPVLTDIIRAESAG